ncbi:MAG: tetratricopeptide repeat protein [Rhodothermales bacterium]
MINSLSLEPQHSFLANYKIPVLAPGQRSKVKTAGATPLSTLQHRMADPRALSLRMILSNGNKSEGAEAAEIKSGMAVSMWQAGKNENAVRLADQSLELFSNQWLAHRIKIDVMMAHHHYTEAYDYLMGIRVSSRVAEWDVVLSKRERNLCAASCQWRLKAWDEVDAHLRKAFPKGVKTMPTGLQEDWFRLALYRRQPDDAAEAAALLASSNPLEFTDALLQTLVQQGWSGKALPIYRKVYAKQPRNELLRRRLVALCIKEGEIDEARKLTESGALNLNP